MPRSLNDIATSIDEVADILQLVADAIAGPENAGTRAFNIQPPHGEPIDLRAIAGDLREHAAARQA